ncbi:MAG TPA: hypothetical protein VER17_19745 [Tepidisphaeraceae bacterium]|nr:hypothetical protein [Tepidisphaeraceae bacterium]
MSLSYSFFPLLLTFAMTGALVGLLVWGLRWRREALPPTCRKCGYDVSKRPEGVQRCSECGANLAARGAVTHSRRRANRWVAAPAGVLLVPALGMLTLMVIHFPWTAWFYDAAPVGWIAGFARNNPGPSGDEHRSTWMRRAGSSPEFYDHLLDLHANLAVPWNGQWGDVLFQAYRNNGLSPAQGDRLVKQLFPRPTFTVRAKVRQGDPLVLDAASPTRAGRSDILTARSILAARANGEAVLDEKKYWSVGRLDGNEQRTIAARDWGGTDLPPGRHKVAVLLARQVVGSSRTGGDWPAISQRIEHRGEVEVEVLPRGAPLGEPVEDPARQTEVAGQVSLKVSHWHDGRVFAEIRLFPAGVDRAFAIYAVVNGKERRIGEVCAPLGGEATSNAIYVPVPNDQGPKLDRLTLVLVGDGEPLKTTLSQTKYWAGRIVYPDVPLGKYEDHYADRGPARPSSQPFRIESVSVTRPGPLPATQPAS